MRKSNYLTHLFRMKEVSGIMLAVMFLFATNFANRAMAQTPDEADTWHEAESKTLLEQLSDMVSNLSDESAVPLIQALSTLNSIKELSPEKYEELKKAYPAGTIPSMESINKSVREIKDSLEAQMSKNIWETYIELHKTLRKEMSVKGLDTLSSSKKVYHFTEDGQLTFTDEQGIVYNFTIDGDEISEEEIEFLIDGISKLTEDGATGVNKALEGVLKSMFGSLNEAITSLEEKIDDSSFSEEETSKDEEEDPYKEFVSPQWGLKCPEGYIRMTEYKELAKTDAIAREQLDKLTSLMDKYKAKRQEMMKSAYKKVTTRHPDVEAKAQKYADRLFERAKIEMLDLGAYRLPDGTIVIEDDKSEQSYVKRPVEWLKGTDTDKGRPLNQAPTLERDKSPNYDAHNEQTWPVYTDVQTVGEEEYKIHRGEPQVIRGKNCTYVVEHYGWLHYHHWFYNDSKSKLVDPKTGAQYMVRYAEHFPMDTYFWVHNVTRKYVRMVSVYPPLPEDVTTVDLIPGIKPAEDQLSNSSPYQVYEGLKVQHGMVVY